MFFLLLIEMWLSCVGPPNILRDQSLWMWLHSEGGAWFSLKRQQGQGLFKNSQINTFKVGSRRKCRSDLVASILGTLYF